MEKFQTRSIPVGERKISGQSAIHLEPIAKAFGSRAATIVNCHGKEGEDDLKDE